MTYDLKAKMKSDPDLRVAVGKEIVEAMKVAVVTLTVETFHNILDVKNPVRNTEATMKVEPEHSRVRTGDSGGKKALKIRPGGASIKFRILPAEEGAPEGAYLPLGIAFLRSVCRETRCVSSFER